MVKNNLECTYELLKTLMGMDDMAAQVRIAEEKRPDGSYPRLTKSDKGLFAEARFQGGIEKLKVSEERIKIAQGKRYPDIYAAGQYGGQAGNEFAFKENWYIGVRLSIPVFDGGLIQARWTGSGRSFKRPGRKNGP